MSTELMVTSEITTGLLTTSTSTNSSETKGETEDNNIAIYISVPIVILIILLLVVIAVILIRRHKSHEENAEAVYSGNDMPKRKRSVPGIQNQAYCIYSIDDNKLKSDENKNNNGIYRKTSYESFTDLPKSVSYQNINYQPSNELPNIYQNNWENSTEEPKGSSYTYVTHVPGGFEVKNDVYSDLTFEDTEYYIDASEKAKSTKATKGRLNKPRIGHGNHKEDTSNSDVYSDVTFEEQDYCHDAPLKAETTKGVFKTYEICRGSGTKEVNKSNIEPDWSVYDHAMAGGADPEVLKSNESFNITEARSNENGERGENPTRHSYVNVTNQNNHVTNIRSNTRNMYDHIELAENQSSQNAIGEEYSHLNGIGNTGIKHFPHKYENVIQGDNYSQRQRKHNNSYEEPFGSTPNYFVVKQD